MGESVEPVERPRSLTAIVTGQIRDLIVTDGLALGQQLSEDALAERLGVHRTPVREALLRLAAECLVEVRPHPALSSSAASRKRCVRSASCAAFLRPAPCASPCGTMCLACCAGSSRT